MRAQLTEFVRFGLVGGTATVVHFGMVALLLETTRLSAVSIHLAAYGAAFFVSFFGHYHITFRSERSYRAALVRFLAVSSSVVAASSVIVILLNGTGVSTATSSLVAAASVPLLSYLLGKWIVY